MKNRDFEKVFKDKNNKNKANKSEGKPSANKVATKNFTQTRSRGSGGK